MIALGGWDDLTFYLRPAAGHVSGKVVDEQGTPVSGHPVILGPPCIPQATCTTDAEGRFRIADLIPGEEVTLVVGWERRNVRVGEEEITIVVKKKPAR